MKMDLCITAQFQTEAKLDLLKEATPDRGVLMEIREEMEERQD